MQTIKESNYSSPPPEEFVRRIRNGESALRDALIEYYYNYILSVVSKMIGRPAQSSDEFSIGLQAFQEAIDRFDETRNVSFLYFAGLVINRRVIDYIRRSNRSFSEYPFTYFEADESESCIEKFAAEQPRIFTDNLEIQEELIQFRQDLSSYGITFEDLVRLAPKHLDTKLLCISVAKKLTESPELSEKLATGKKLPIAELLSVFSLHRKTIENHRKYIIALFLVLRSDMEIIKGYCSFLMKGVN
jgi:RNA polymerase sigma factor